jgi:hypothetical protein
MKMNMLTEQEIKSLVQEVLSEIDWNSYDEQMARLKARAEVGEAGREDGKVFLVLSAAGEPLSAWTRKDDAILESYAVSDEGTNAAIEKELARVQAQAPNVPAARLKAAIAKRIGVKNGKVIAVPFHSSHKEEAFNS